MNIYQSDSIIQVSDCAVDHTHLDWIIAGRNYEGEWWHKKRKPHNSFIDNMMKILESYYAITEGKPFQKGKEPEWNGQISEEVMYMNIYPFATENIGQLHKLMKACHVDTWEHIVKPIRVLVKECIKPDVIVFAGKEAYDLFMWKQKETFNENIITGKSPFGDNMKVVAFKRSPGYHGDENLKEIGRRVAEAGKSEKH